jgi:hypothetical protein
MPVRCGSSVIMSELMAWRNRYGKEEHWPETQDRVFNLRQHVVKALASEVGAILLAASSLIETIAYAALILVAATAYPATRSPLKFAVKLLESSAFTSFWAFRESLGPNFFSLDRPTHESYARKRLYCVRQEDLEYIEQMKPITSNDPQFDIYFSMLNARATLEFRDEHVVDNDFDQLIQLTCPELDVYRQMGTMWLRDHVFEKVAVETRNQLSPDPEGISFVLTKTAFEYVLGSAREDTLPTYLKLASRRLIHALRSELTAVEPEDLKEIADCLFTLEAYRAGPRRPKALAIFTKLRSFEAVEMQRSFYLTKCLQTAFEMS